MLPQFYSLLIGPDEQQGVTFAAVGTTVALDWSIFGTIGNKTSSLVWDVAGAVRGEKKLFWSVFSPLVLPLSPTKSVAVQAAADAVGFEFQIAEPGESPIDLTEASLIRVVLLSPDGNRTSDDTGRVKSPATDGLAQYFVQPGFLTTSGLWKIQAEVFFTNGEQVYSPVYKIKAKANI